MKLEASLLLFMVGTCYSQFHQNTYHIEHDTLTFVKVNTTSTVNPIMTIFKYNDTTRMKAINGSAYFTPGVKKNILLKVKVFKFVAGAFRRFPINVTLDACQEAKVKTNAFGARNAIDKSNLHGCPCAPGFYYIYNFLLEEDKFPPHIPLGKYKLIIDVTVDDRVFMMTIEWNGSVIPRSKDMD